MVEGVQFSSFAQAAAATLKLLRSAQSRTLPAKNTITVTGQLIGRTSARGIALAAVSGPAGIAFSPDRLDQRHLSLTPPFAVFSTIRLTRSLTGPAISRSAANGAVVKVSTRRAGSGALFGPKPTTPIIQAGLG